MTKKELGGDRTQGSGDRPVPHGKKSHLEKNHHEELYASGLSDEAIAACGYRSVNAKQAKQLTGYELSGLLIPYLDINGEPYPTKDGHFYRLKPKWPKTDKDEDKPKYLTPKEAGCRPYFSRLVDWVKVASKTSIDVSITEGEKKSDSGCAHGIVTIGLAGVYAWLDKCDRNTWETLSESRPLPELDEIEWRGRRVNLIFDSDIIQKIGVQGALARLADWLIKKGAYPYLVLVPTESDGTKMGWTISSSVMGLMPSSSSFRNLNLFPSSMRVKKKYLF